MTLRYPELVKLCSGAIRAEEVKKLEILCGEIVSGCANHLIEDCLVCLFDNDLSDPKLLIDAVIVLTVYIEIRSALTNAFEKLKTVAGAKMLLKHLYSLNPSSDSWSLILLDSHITDQWSTSTINIVIELIPTLPFHDLTMFDLRLLCDKVRRSDTITQLANAFIACRKLGNIGDVRIMWLMRYACSWPDPTLYKMLIRSGESHSLSAQHDLDFKLNPWIVLHMVNEGKCNVEQDTHICDALVDPYISTLDKNDYLLKLAILFDREKLGMGSSDIKFTPDCKKTISELLGRSTDTIPILSNFNTLYTRLISTLHSLLGKDLSGLVFSYLQGG